MLRDERLNFIETYVNKHKYVSVQNLMQILDISKATVRRDLQMLSDENRLMLVRGGASTRNSFVMNELPYEQKQHKFDAEKRRIAKAGFNFVKEGNTIVLDSGTTTRMMVPLLTQIPNIHIFTCDIAIASDFSYHPNVNVTVIGGTLRNGYFSLNGYFAESLMRSLRADIAFCGIDAIHPTGGCMTGIEDVGIKKQIIASSNQSVMLCDHSKFSKDAMASVCKISDVSLYITGNEISNDVLNQFEEIQDRLVKV